MPEAAAASSGRISGGVHRYRLRVFYEDTDAAGIVYHANYLRFAERARTEMLRLLGFGQRALAEAEGIAFAVRRCLVEFLAPARLDDHLEVRSRITAVGGATVDAEQMIVRLPAAGEAGGEVALTRLALRLACVRTSGRPGRLPPVVRRALAGLASERTSQREG